MSKTEVQSEQARNDDQHAICTSLDWDARTKHRTEAHHRMLLGLPADLICNITGMSPLAAQAALTRTCHSLYRICNRTLYRHDSQYHGSSAIFHAITRYADQKVVIGTLRTNCCRNRYQPRTMSATSTKAGSRTTDVPSTDLCTNLPGRFKGS